MQIRPIQPADDSALYHIIQTDLQAAGLALPGTAYYDPELATLSQFYAAQANRQYFVVVNAQRVVGGAGVAAYDAAHGVAELQKLYLRADAQGQGLSYQLIQHVAAFARQAGYRQLYLETHHRLAAALHVYHRAGFRPLPGPLRVAEHPTMDRFMLKDLI
ncbi:GNAT family N-acetyltransferase [Levilactobacillus zymae]|uniref:GNAT family N-acetyltransferase n=1 Tax=Levilactobacillus zymae TaxID=267363 RepID=UPI0028BBFD81|nr:GNAT family N-acetyltransferase [Levilactobacillus zymae]MDT6980725.1 GNAT family N-acetyltransferase [Levilactobacillus zymae]